MPWRTSTTSPTRRSRASSRAGRERSRPAGLAPSASRRRPASTRSSGSTSRTSSAASCDRRSGALREVRVLPGTSADLATIAAPLDFLGINYYHPEYVRADPAAGPIGAAPAAPAAAANAAGWHVDPHGLRQILARLRAAYAPLPVWVTENGVPDDPGTPPVRGDIVEYPERVAYLRAHLQALDAAIEEGADVPATSTGRSSTTSNGSTATPS